MNFETKNIGKAKYIDEGSGEAVVLLHGLMGGLSNFDDTVKALVSNGYRVIVPRMPLYTISMLKANVTGLAAWVYSFLRKKLNLEKFTLVGNSLGGHIALIIARDHKKRVKSLVLTGSSGLYENLGSSFPRRGDYQYIKEKTEEVFFSPKTATKELIDEVFEIVGNRLKVLHTISISRSAMKLNMAKDLPKIEMPTCLIWGEDDIVTPPQAAEEFHQLLPNNELHWIKECGHAAMMEQPEQFNSLLIDFLKRQPADKEVKNI